MARHAVPTPGGSALSNPLRAVSLVLLVLASVASGWLAYQALQSGTIPGCEDGGCATVLASKWAKTFGVPVGFFGAAAYILLAILGARPFFGDRQKQARVAAAALVVLIPAAAIWFASLQIFVVKAFCKWCTATHVLATAGAVLMALAWRRDLSTPGSRGRKSQTSPALPSVWGPAAVAAALAFGGFVGAQILSPEPPRPRVLTASMSSPAARPAATSAAPLTNPPALASTSTATTPDIPAPTPAASTSAPASPVQAAVPPPPESAPRPADPRRLDLHEGRFVLEPRDLPCVGSPEARHLMVMISDYTCVHCRQASRTLREVREAFGADQLGTVMLPTQHGGDSLEIQRLMLAAWKLDPKVWSEVASEIYQERLQPKSASVRPVLEQRLGADRLASTRSATEAWATNLLALTKEILVANRAKTKSGNIPQFIMGTEIVVGEPNDAAEFYDLIERNLGLVRDRFPDLRLASGEFDLGRVFAGTTHTLSVLFTNVGQAPLQVARATPPVGARVIRGLQTPVAPGATSVVQFAITAPRDAGPFEQTLTLFSNTRPPQTPVRIKGTAWKPIQISPALLDFGRLDPSAAVTQGVIRIQLDEAARLASVQAQNPGFKASLREVESGKRYEIDVATTPALAAGVQQSTLVVTLEKPVPKGWPDNIAVGARALVERGVMAMPPRLVLPAGALPTERHHQVLVRCTDGTADFSVTGAVLEGGPALTQPEVKPVGSGRDSMVLVTLPAGWSIPPPPVSTRLVISTSHPRYPVIEVPLVNQGQ